MRESLIALPDATLNASSTILNKLIRQTSIRCLFLPKILDIGRRQIQISMLLPPILKIIHLPNSSNTKPFLDKLSPDLVHFCMPQQPVLYKGNHITTVHDLNLLNTYNSDKNWLIFHLKQLVGRFVFKRIGKTSSAIITPTNFVKNSYINFAKIPAAKVTVTPEAAEPASDAIAPYPVPFEKRFILYVGQQSDYKNIKRLGDAHQELLKTHPDLGLVLVGKKDAAARKNEAYFSQKQYVNIHFTDFVPDDQLNWLYENCTAYIFPSLMEGFGLPGLEAMIRGVPVISSNTTCLPEVYGDAAWYFNPLDSQNMARKIEEVLNSEQIQTELIKKGREKAGEYSWHRMAIQTHEVYVKALETNHAN